MNEETQREAKKRINIILTSLPCLEEKDKLKMYSWKEIRENNKIIEIDINNFKRFDIKYCDIHGFSCHLGKICWICQSSKTGLGNPEVHKKTIQNQIKNGTFNMLNTEIQRNKISNINLKSEIKVIYCENCGKETKHFVWGNSSKCCVCNAKNNGLQEKYCEKCEEVTCHNGNICTKCNPIAAIQNNLHYEFCQECNEETYHNGKFCIKCNPESSSLKPLSFIENNNCSKHEYCKMQFYDKTINKYICWECYKDKWEKDQKLYIPKIAKCKQCEIPTVINKLFCSDKCEEIYKQDKFKQFKHNNKCEKHTNNNLTYNVKCWECWKDELKNLNINFYNNFLNEIKELYQNMLLQTTFRTQESLDWIGKKLAFEQDLVDKGFKWIAYIKFYIDKDGNIIPLVCGKTGSFLVNNSVTDVIFSTDINHGPARKFLKDNSFEWDKTQILIIPCKTEKIALSIEEEIINRYNLFES